MNLFLRLYADCETSEQAQGIAGRICLALHHLSPSELAPPTPYWKVSHQFEFTYTLKPPTSLSFRSIIEASSGGWSQQEAGLEESAVWSRQGDLVFIEPEVNWANVELHETAP
jgi:hypothetical protein